MYDDLARTQRAGVLEQLVVRFVIPSVLTSFVLQSCDLSGSVMNWEHDHYICFGGGYMGAISSVTSISVHAAVGAALLLGPAKLGRSTPTVEYPVIIDFPPTARPAAPWGVGIGVPMPDLPLVPDLGSIAIPADMLQGDAFKRPAFATDWSPKSGAGIGQPGEGGSFDEAPPEVLAGPLPAYPELLRQAGVEGQVVLEAVVDSSGRVQRASVSVVSATHAGFVEPARQALISTLFRPARVNGRAVPTLVRVPFAFSIRGGTGRAR